MLRLESEGDSFLIGSTVWGVLPLDLERYPFLRFVVRIDDAPAGSDLIDERIDDSALRIMTVFRKEPPRSIVYAWTSTLPVGAWSARGRSILGDFREVRRKSFGQGRPPAGQWLTVEVNLLADYRTQFPAGAPPTLRGVALKTDSNDVDDGRSLAWIRSVSLHEQSLRGEGLKEWDALGDTVVWFR